MGGLFTFLEHSHLIIYLLSHLLLGFSEKYFPSYYMLEYLVPSWWCYVATVWNLLVMAWGCHWYGHSSGANVWGINLILTQVLGCMIRTNVKEPIHVIPIMEFSHSLQFISSVIPPPLWDWLQFNHNSQNCVPQKFVSGIKNIIKISTHFTWDLVVYLPLKV